MNGGRVGQPIHNGFAINIGGMMNVVEAVRLTGVRRLVHLSTFGVYNWRRESGAAVDEDFSASTARSDTWIRASRF